MRESPPDVQAFGAFNRGDQCIPSETNLLLNGLKRLVTLHHRIVPAMYTGTDRNSSLSR